MLLVTGRYQFPQENDMSDFEALDVRERNKYLDVCGISYLGIDRSIDGESWESYWHHAEGLSIIIDNKTREIIFVTTAGDGSEDMEAAKVRIKLAKQGLESFIVEELKEVVPSE